MGTAGRKSANPGTASEVSSNDNESSIESNDVSYAAAADEDIDDSDDGDDSLAENVRGGGVNVGSRVSHQRKRKENGERVWERRKMERRKAGGWVTPKMRHLNRLHV